ncbi:uncharacterized protein V6R79_000125 [Siganus canaliculatus]
MQLLNSSGVSYFTLAAYLDLGPLRPLCFLLLLSFYAAIVCSNVLLILACSDTTVNNVYGLMSTAVTVFCLLSMVLYAYAKILKICLSGSRQMRQKAVSTCSPHLVSLLNFSFGCFFEVVQSRFDMSGVPPMLRVFLSLYWLTSPPLFNPLLYGLNLSSIRTSCRSLVGDWLRAANPGLHHPDPRAQRRPGPT